MDWTQCMTDNVLSIRHTRIHSKYLSSNTLFPKRILRCHSYSYDWHHIGNFSTVTSGSLNFNLPSIGASPRTGIQERLCWHDLVHYNTEYVRQPFEVKAVKQGLNWFLNPMLG
jgi:hypothetical protein